MTSAGSSAGSSAAASAATRPGVKVGVGATITRTAPAARAAEDDPDPFEPPSRGTPGWSSLPMPLPDNTNAGVEIYGSADEREDASDPDTSHDVEDSGPIGGAIGKLLEAVRGDAYVMFIGGAAIIILMLIAILFALR